MCKVLCRGSPIHDGEIPYLSNEHFVDGTLCTRPYVSTIGLVYHEHVLLGCQDSRDRHWSTWHEAVTSGLICLTELVFFSLTNALVHSSSFYFQPQLSKQYFMDFRGRHLYIFYIQYITDNTKWNTLLVQKWERAYRQVLYQT